MSENEMTEGLASFLGGDHELPMVTTEAVSEKLSNFPLPLAPGKDIGWLALCSRRALALSIESIEQGNERTSNRDIRAELERMASRASTVWGELFQMTAAADHHLWTHAVHHYDVDPEAPSADVRLIGEPYGYKRAKLAISELEWLSDFIRDASNAVEEQSARWRQSELRRLRVERGLRLAAVFEVAFDQAPTANNWPSGKDHKPSYFMDFYQRMVALAFGEQGTPDISGVLKEACRIHKQTPASFNPEIVPLNGGALAAG